MAKHLPFGDLNAIEMIRCELEDQIKAHLQISLASKLGDELLADARKMIEDEVGAMVARIAIPKLERVRDMLELRDELKLFIKVQNEATGETTDEQG